jgi:hypothetical protein
VSKLERGAYMKAVNDPVKIKHYAAKNLTINININILGNADAAHAEVQRGRENKKYKIKTIK